MKIKLFFLGLCIVTLITFSFAGSWVNGVWIDFTTASAQGANISAKIYTRDPGFSKLVFIAEGFDAGDGTSNEFTLDSLYNSVGVITNGINSIYTELVLNNNYTLVLVDFDNNWSDIKKQGYALGVLMQNMWNLSPKAEPIKYIGLSMGGVIGSFACGLKQFYTLNPSYTKESWEQPLYSSWNFEVNLCLTVDTPHSGAFIPGGVYSFVDFFRGSPDGAQAQQFYNSLTSQAACQMLIRKYGSFNVTTWNALYRNVLTAYKQTNAINFVGFCNGSWAGNKQFSSNNNVLLINWHYDPLGCGEAWTTIRSEPEDLIKKEIYWGKWGACFVMGEELTRWCVHPNEYDIFENCPGGYTNSYQDIVNALPGSKPTPVYKSHCFVPTFSAAALDFNTYAPINKRNLKNLELQSGQQMEVFSPMHKLYHQDNENQWHVRGLALAPYFVNSIFLEIKEKTLMYQNLYHISSYLN